jgi:hypothetical protein
MSFTVFARARPVRTAFLLNEAAGFNAVCDGLEKWSNEFWGGRQCAVALIENDGTLTTEAWQEISRFDPDRIYSFAPISDDLLAKLNEELSPWHIRQPKDNQRSDRPVDEIEETVESPGIPVSPTEQNLAALQKRPLLLFEFSKDCPALFATFPASQSWQLLSVVRIAHWETASAWLDGKPARKKSERDRAFANKRSPVVVCRNGTNVGNATKSRMETPASVFSSL